MRFHCYWLAFLFLREEVYGSLACFLPEGPGQNDADVLVGLSPVENTLVCDLGDLAC